MIPVWGRSSSGVLRPHTLQVMYQNLGTPIYTPPPSALEKYYILVKPIFYMSFWLRRLFLIVFFIFLGGTIYLLLPNHPYRLLLAFIPFAFSIQLTLSDCIEVVLTSKVGVRTWWFSIFLAPGTILHELCHLITAFATGCKIHQVCLFSPNPKTGVLGYVGYSMNRDKWVVLREFLIAFAPFFGCGTMLFISNYFLGGNLLELLNSTSLYSYHNLINFIFSAASSLGRTFTSLELTNILVWIYFYLQFCFAVGAAPSWVDFSGFFNSLKTNIYSTLIFIFILSSLIFLTDSQSSSSLGLLFLSQYFILILKSMALILILSIIFSGFVLPISYIADNISDIKGIERTIPLSLSLVFAFFTWDYLGPKLSFAISFSLMALSIYMLKKRF